ncbi:hypothetical protein LNQ81_00735 [Myroides sp. M-43]|uniref:hypothetical protein n=1 Tax=Myroides oncorhynchi TaxID=2893756 RepID=UPI001E2A56D8|nr:hypothetical protein [Myroides oncorhynchi]MCC9041265.1 hypothetical protein [Myroides oncorhynchi]
MKKAFLYILILIVMPCVYGQTSSPSFRTPASIVYLNSNPSLYFNDANIRFFNMSSAFMPYSNVNENVWEEDYSFLTSMKNKYSALNTDVKFNNGKAIDLRSYVNGVEKTRAENENRKPRYPYPTKWRKDLSVVGNVLNLLFSEY